ncbi:glycoside hydrolase, partial [Lasiosphaeria hispida]
FQIPAPDVPGWYANNTDIGFVPPQSVQSVDIVCHKSAVPGHDYANVQAGSNIMLQWLTWPESHVGPIMDYLAPCPESGCTDVDKDDLHFVKIAQQALKLKPGIASKTDWLKAWVIDDFIHGDFKWNVQIPSDLSAG